jgi:hypothetical protein
MSLSQLGVCNAEVIHTGLGRSMSHSRGLIPDWLLLFLVHRELLHTHTHSMRCWPMLASAAWLCGEYRHYVSTPQVSDHLLPVNDLWDYLVLLGFVTFAIVWLLHLARTKCHYVWVWILLFVLIESCDVSEESSHSIKSEDKKVDWRLEWIEDNRYKNLGDAKIGFSKNSDAGQRE